MSPQPLPIAPVDPATEAVESMIIIDQAMGTAGLVTAHRERMARRQSMRAFMLADPAQG